MCGQLTLTLGSKGCGTKELMDDNPPSPTRAISQKDVYNPEVDSQQA
jgi:hypothetical protein